MRSSCVSHPSNSPLLIIRDWQVKACNGNGCAAALLSYFEYWHNIKLGQSRQAQQLNEAAVRNGENVVAEESLLQYHTYKELQNALLGLFGRDSIRLGIKLLEQLKFISIHPSPYAWDRTGHYLFHKNNVNDWIVQNNIQPLELDEDAVSEGDAEMEGNRNSEKAHHDTRMDDSRCAENRRSIDLLPNLVRN